MKLLTQASRVSLSSTHTSIQHVSSTQRPLLFSPQNLSVRHQCVSSTRQMRHFNTSVQHKFVSSTRRMRQCNTNTSVLLLNWSICVKLTHLCWTDAFVLKWRFFALNWRFFVLNWRFFVLNWRFLWNRDGFQISRDFLIDKSWRFPDIKRFFDR